MPWSPVLRSNRAPWCSADKRSASSGILREDRRHDALLAPIRRIHCMSTSPISRFARTNANGEVEFSGDFYMLETGRSGQGQQAVCCSMSSIAAAKSRSECSTAPRAFRIPSSAEEFGNGFLMRHGYTVAWVGWQADVRGVTDSWRWTFRVHAASRIHSLRDAAEQARGDAAARRPLSHPQSNCRLGRPASAIAREEHAGAAAVEIPRGAWRFCDPGHIELKGAFTPGSIYDVIYRSAEPPLVGLGFLAVRDTGAWLRWADAASGNPCADTIERAYLFGVSQTGRFLRQMLSLGLDEDEQGRMVFDAVIPHIAGARRGEFNLRLGQPSLNAKEAVGDLPPFHDEGLFARLKQRGPVPRIVLTNSSAEYWRGDASLIHTDSEGSRDIEPADFVRILSARRHATYSRRFAAARGRCEYRRSRPAAFQHRRLCAVDARGARQSRSLGERGRDSSREALFRGWPTARRCPRNRIAAFFENSGRAFSRSHHPPAPARLRARHQRGIAQYPPQGGSGLPDVCSALDGDGNEIGGIRPFELLAPLATFRRLESAPSRAGCRQGISCR